MKLIAVILCTLVLNFTETKAQEKLPKTLLWRITGNGMQHPSYLFGTMHLKDRRLFFFGDSVYKNISTASGFAMELNPEEMLDSMFMKMSKTDTTSLLRKMLDKKKYDAVAKKIEQKTGIPANKITRKKLLELRNNWAYKIKKKDDMDAAVDMYLYNLAKRQGKWTGGIEDIADQIDLDDELGKTIDIEDLVNDVDEKEKEKTAYLEKMISIYTSEDLNELNQFTFGKYGSEERDVMMIRRNIKMAFRMDSLAHVRNTFFAVGAAHLPGDSGLIKLLQRRGFNVEPVFSFAKINPDKYTYTAIETPWVKYTDADSAYTAELPGKPSEMTIPGSEMKMKVYADLFSGLFYITGYSYLLEGQNQETVSKRMGTYFAGEKGLVLEEKNITHHGIDGNEITCSKDGYFYRVQTFVAAQKVYVAITGSEKKELLVTKDAEKFFIGFTANTNIEKKQNLWQHYINNDLYFEAAFPVKPSLDKLLETESAQGFETTTCTAQDKQSANYYMVVVSKIKKGFFIEEDSAIFNAKLNYYRQQEAVIEDLRYFRYEGYPAMSFTAFKKNNGFDFAVKLLVICRGNISYTTAAVAQKGKEDFPDVTNFFRNFKFLPEKNTQWQQYQKTGGMFNIWCPSYPELNITDTTGLNAAEAKLKLADAEKLLTYTAYDPGNAVSWYVNVEATDKYFWAVNDSSFIMNKLKTMYTDTASYYAKNHPGDFDSLISTKMLYNGNNKGYEVLVKNARKEYAKKVRIFQHGDSTYQLYVIAADTVINSANGKRFFEEFRFTEQNPVTTIFNNKTQVILTDLLSTDSATRQYATKALKTAPFTAKDLPLLHNAYLMQYKENEDSYRTINEEIAGVIEEQKDSSTLDFIKNNYNKNDTTIANLKMGMLNMLANIKTTDAYNTLKTFIISNPPKKADGNDIFYRFSDSLSLAKQLFPECASLLGDSIFGSGFINTAVALSDSNLISTSIITDNAKGIITTASLQVKQLKKVPDYYPAFNEAVITALERINSKDAFKQLNGYLSATDLDIKTSAAISLLKLNQQVLPEQLKKIASVPAYRVQLFEKMQQVGKEKFFPAVYLTQQKFAEGYLYSNAEEDELENASFTFLKEKTVVVNKVQQRYFIFKNTIVNEEEKISYLAVCGPFNMNRSKVLATKKYPDIKIFWDDKYEEKSIDKLFDLFIKELNEPIKK